MECPSGIAERIVATRSTLRLVPSSGTRRSRSESSCSSSTCSSGSTRVSTRSPLNSTCPIARFARASSASPACSTRRDSPCLDRSKSKRYTSLRGSKAASATASRAHGGWLGVDEAPTPRTNRQCSRSSTAERTPAMSCQRNPPTNRPFDSCSPTATRSQ